MKLPEAIASNRPIRRKSSPRVVGSSGDGWIHPDYFIRVMGVSKEDILADDWEIQSKPIEITREQFYDALKAAYIAEDARKSPRAHSGYSYDAHSFIIAHLAKELGLG